MADDKRCACPKCGEPLCLQAIVRPEQRLTIRLTTTGGMVTAKAVAALITATVTCLEASAECLNGAVTVLLEDVVFGKKNIDVKLLVLEGQPKEDGDAPRT